ncbi:MAG: DivIVA domain-containing protein [Eubacteriales bacterium]|nr:DivIVA domain-containing protein [Eubacteriales bacterium]
MAITVSDIEQKEFAYKGAGYDPYDVDQYLDQICDEMIALQEHITQLEEELTKARREAEVAVNAVKPVQPVVVKPAEETVGKTTQTLETILINAQRLADGAVEDAKRRAEDIIKAAQDKADGVLKEANGEKETLEAAFKSLRASAADFRKNLLTMIEDQKELLESNDTLFTDKK